MDDLDFMTLAVLEAEAAMLRGDVPVGAVLVRDGEVLAAGSNTKTIDPTAHAEIQAIRAGAERLGNWNLRECDLYVTLEPCPMCAGACVAARIRTIIFGSSDPRAGAVGTLYDIPSDRRLNHRCAVRSGILKERCEALLKEYFIMRRKTKSG
ncbi:tRNA-specific adenosine deaminase [Synergistales bacterium]|nr:tRNA-specific adenosine deaminase [Synergistales bacterium]